MDSSSTNNEDFLFQENISKNKLKGINAKKHSNFKKINYFKKLDQIKYLVFFILIFLLQSGLNNPIKKREANYKFYSNEITIKIKGKGEQRILNAGYKNCPNFIYLNGGTTNILGTDCHLVNIPEENDELNTLKLIWNEKATTCYNMFFKMADNLIEVDLSKFDTSSVVSMEAMFQDCHSIQSINLQNVDTSNVKSMRFMFGDNYALTDLDLSSFDTSNVIDMYWMFALVRLTSLNLSNFDTSKLVILLNIASIITTLEVSKLERFKDVNCTTANIQYISITFEVSKEDKSNSVKA